jgi:hypothetical protein
MFNYVIYSNFYLLDYVKSILEFNRNFNVFIAKLEISLTCF